LSSFLPLFFVFCFTAPSPSELYTLSLHDALPIFARILEKYWGISVGRSLLIFDVIVLTASLTYISLVQMMYTLIYAYVFSKVIRSEEHTSELQSRFDLVCRLLLEKKKKYNKFINV